jgi:hypothetical protein
MSEDAPRENPEWVGAATARGAGVELIEAIGSRLPGLRLEGRDEDLDARVGLGLVAEARSARKGDRTLDGFGSLEPLDQLDLASARAFTLALVEGWVASGFAGSRDWIFVFVHRFPSAALVTFITSKLGHMSRANATSRRLIDALGWMDSPEAFYYLDRFRENKSGQGLPGYGSSVAYTSRTRFGLDEEEYQDLCMPTLDLGPGAVRELDYGPRTVTMRYVAGEVVFQDSKGKAYKNLPRARKTDDADKVAALRDELMPALKIFRENHRRAAVRLERDMNVNRQWRVEHVTGRLLTHPIVSQMVRGLVWDLGGGVFARPDEEGQFIGVDFEPVSLEGVGFIRIARVSEMGDELMPWVEHFEDFELVQPVEQLTAAQFVPGSPVIAELFHEVEAGELTLDIRTIKRLYKDGVLTVDGRNGNYWQKTSKVGVRLGSSKYEFVAQVNPINRIWKGWDKDPIVVEKIGRRVYKEWRWERDEIITPLTAESLAAGGYPAEEVIAFFKALVAMRSSA